MNKKKPSSFSLLYEHQSARMKSLYLTTYDSYSTKHTNKCKLTEISDASG